MPRSEALWVVRYQYGAYSGTREAWAEDRAQAIAKVKRELRPYMTLPMAYESYKATLAPSRD